MGNENALCSGNPGRTGMGGAGKPLRLSGPQPKRERETFKSLAEVKPRSGSLGELLGGQPGRMRNKKSKARGVKRSNSENKASDVESTTRTWGRETRQ